MTKTIFGPVASRRLGRSLGVDLVPYKLCPYDCVYCQLGPTTDRTSVRGVFFDTRKILADVRKFLTDGEMSRGLDVITLAGSGEPTLAENAGQVICGIRKMTSIPVAVLTNGALMDRDDVRRDLMEADIVIPSVDAVDDDTALRINRPGTGINLSAILEGLQKFSRMYRGYLSVEVMVIAGINDSDQVMRSIAGYVAGLIPDEVHLNRSVRPVTDSSALSPSRERMTQLAGFFPDRLKVKLTSDRQDSGSLSIPSGRPAPDFLLMAHLARRPGTPGDIARGLGLDVSVVLDSLELLVRQGRVACRAQGAEELYYAIRQR